MDCMDLQVHCLRKAIKLTHSAHSLTHSLAQLNSTQLNWLTLFTFTNNISYIVNIMAFDNLMMQEAKAWAAKIPI